MAFEPGDVVFLKSGGSAMTVAAVEGTVSTVFGSAKRVTCSAKPSRPSR